MRLRLRKTSLPAFIILLGFIVGTVACKLTSSGNGFSTTPPTTSSEYLFATSSNQVWSFSVDGTTGALSAAAGVTGPALSYGILGDPAGKFLYVSDSVADQVDVFSISSTGTLTAITNSPYTVGTALPAPANNATGLAMDSAGKFLFAADDANDAIASFTVNSSTGALTAVTNSPFSTGATTEPVQLVVDASNSFVYSSDVASAVGGVSAFNLTGSGSSAGALTAIPGFSPFTTVLNGEPIGLATAGKFVYVSENSANRVVALSISNTGGLAPIPNSPYSSGNSPVGVAISPSGKFLYVANANDNTISGYTVDSTTGELIAMSNSPFATTASPWYLAIDPSGKFLYTTNPQSTDNTITGFTIDSTTGALTQFSGSATAVGTQPVALTVVTVAQ